MGHGRLLEIQSLLDLQYTREFPWNSIEIAFLKNVRDASTMSPGDFEILTSFC